MRTIIWCTSTAGVLSIILCIIHATNGNADAALGWGVSAICALGWLMATKTKGE